MKRKFLNLIFLSVFLSMFTICVNAQIGNCSNIADNRREPYPEQIREKLIELCIERAKKDFQDLLDRGEEIAKLTEELETSYLENNGFSLDDREKLDKIEDLVKKIRKDLKANDEKDEEKESKPVSLLEAVKTLKETTSDLFEELKKTSRYSISAVAVQSSNALLKLVHFIKIGN